MNNAREAEGGSASTKALRAAGIGVAGSELSEDSFVNPEVKMTISERDISLKSSVEQRFFEQFDQLRVEISENYELRKREMLKNAGEKGKALKNDLLSHLKIAADEIVAETPSRKPVGQKDRIKIPIVETPDGHAVEVEQPGLSNTVRKLNCREGSSKPS